MCRIGFSFLVYFRLLAVDDKLRQCAELLLESLSCLTLEEQKELAIFFVPEVRVGVKKE